MQDTREIPERPPQPAPDPRPWPDHALSRHVHRPRDFGVGYGNSSGYGSERHFVDGHADPMFRCV